MNEWISIKKRLPPFRKLILITDGTDISLTSRSQVGPKNEVWWDVEGVYASDVELRVDSNSITYWMEVPSLP